MPHIFENMESRRVTEGESPSAELAWTVLGTSNVVEAQGLVFSASPLVFGTARRTLYRKDYTVEPDGRNRWRGSTLYGTRDDSNEDQRQLSFQVSGETVHITQALQTIGRYRAGDSPKADFKGAIGVDKDGEVKGCDILTGKLSFTETHYFPLGLVDDVYVKRLASTVGKVNANTFRTFASGEVMLVGASGAIQWDRERWEISYTFDTSPNVTGIEIGDITVSSKLGFDYLWVQYEKVDDDEAKQIAARPIQANVERVYRFAPYSVLGIGD